MSYHVEAPRFGFKELPERILVREDGAYGASKEHGEPIIDHWYVPEQDAPQAALEARVDELCAENERLRERLKASDDGRMRQADNLIDKCHKIARLQTENAELRELLDYMTPIAWYAASERERDRMRELEVGA